MAADGTPGTKGNPQFLGGGAPATASDFNTVSTWAADNIDRRVADVAARASIALKYVGMVVQTGDGNIWICTNASGSGTWRPIGTAIFADSTALTAGHGSPTTGDRVRLLTELFDRVYDGTAWRPFGSDEVRLLPTLASTGGSVAVNAGTGEITGSGAITMIRATLAGVADFSRIVCRLAYTGGGTGSHTMKVCSGSSPDATASSYRSQGGFEANTTRAIAAMTPASTGWWHGYTGVRLSRMRTIEFYRLGDAANTRYTDNGGDNDASINEVTMTAFGQHLVASPFDGIQFDFSSLGTFTDLSLTFKGVI